MPLDGNKESNHGNTMEVVMENAIPIFSPTKITSGECSLSRSLLTNVFARGVEFYVGAEEQFDHGKSPCFLGTNTELDGREPYWWVLTRQ